MAGISLCMIVKNEADTLPRCLASVRELVDEIVVVDTGSTDGTKEAARRFTGLVYDFPWADDFAAARNFAFGKGSMDYLMWLDADDVLEPEDGARFRAEKAALEPGVDVVMMPYHAAFGEDGAPSFTYERERLVRRAAGFRWEGAVHEAIAPAGRVVRWTAAVSHRKTRPGDPERNLRIYEGLLERGRTLSPREQFYYARELACHGRDREAARVLEDFLDAGQGWLENVLQACRDLAGCYERLGEPERAFSALVRSLRYAPPRPEACCALGSFFFQREDWAAACFWYELALHCPPGAGGGFVEPDCAGYLPLLQLCVCAYRMGERKRAEEYNERAGAIKPQGAAYLYNRAFFRGDGGAPPGAPTRCE